MFRGFYISANGIINQERIINTVTNNIANSQTAGYKKDVDIPTTFEERLIRIKDENNQTGKILYRTQDYTWTNTEQGTFDYTNSPLDMAIQGNLFFNIEDRITEEQLLTRNGQFTIDGEGYLSLGSSGRVLDDTGATILLGTSDFTVTEDGTLTTADGMEYRLGLTYIESGADIEKVGDNKYRPYPDEDGNVAEMGNIPEDEKYKIIQGAYERSNVDIADEMITAMAAQRNFEAASQALQIINGINQIAANDLMKI